MREFKFRAWNTRTKMMDFGQHLQDLIEFPPYGSVNLEHYIVWMQYTGLLDKKGIEVYEGDFMSDENGYVYKVIYDTSEARFGADIVGGNRIYDLNKNEVIKCEVIGNIYENKELLDEETK